MECRSNEILVVSDVFLKYLVLRLDDLRGPLEAVSMDAKSLLDPRRKKIHN